MASGSGTSSDQASGFFCSRTLKTHIADVGSDFGLVGLQGEVLRGGDEVAVRVHGVFPLPMGIGYRKGGQKWVYRPGRGPWQQTQSMSDLE